MLSLPGPATMKVWQRFVRRSFPGVGVKLEFTTEEGRIVGVLVHRDGRREILIYDDDDPDACSSSLELTAADTRTMSELLGGSTGDRSGHGRPAADRGSGDRVDRDPERLGDGRHDDRRRAVPHEDRFVDRRGHPRRRHDAGTRARSSSSPAGDVAVAVGTVEGLATLRDVMRH